MDYPEQTNVYEEIFIEHLKAVYYSTPSQYNTYYSPHIISAF